MYSCRNAEVSQILDCHGSLNIFGRMQHILVKVYNYLVDGEALLEQDSNW